MKKFRVQEYNPKTGPKRNIGDFNTLREAQEFVKNNYSWYAHEYVGDEHYYYLEPCGYGGDEVDIFEIN